MYYKITDKESEAWQKADGFLNRLSQLREENAKELQERVGKVFSDVLRRQHLFNLNGEIIAIKPAPGQELGKEWAPFKHEDYQGYYKPNTRTKAGRDLQDFLSHLPHLQFQGENELWGLDRKNYGNKIFLNGYHRYEGGILISTQEYVETLVCPGLEEITRSEYQSLKGQEDDD